MNECFKFGFVAKKYANFSICLSTCEYNNFFVHFRQANLGVANVRRMEKSKRWCLKRLNYEGPDKIIYLNEGETTIGRNKSADITSKSKYCSRNQCVITLNRSGVIIVKNLVSELIIH